MVTGSCGAWASVITVLCIVVVCPGGMDRLARRAAQPGLDELEQLTVATAVALLGRGGGVRAPMLAPSRVAATAADTAAPPSVVPSSMPAASVSRAPSGDRGDCTEAATEAILGTAPPALPPCKLVEAAATSEVGGAGRSVDCKPPLERGATSTAAAPAVGPANTKLAVLAA
jgi:hypothetical protein